MGTVTWKINDNGEVDEFHQAVVHKCTMEWSDDPAIVVAEPIWKWQQSEQGKFVTAHSKEKPSWSYHLNPGTYQYDVAICAVLEKKKLSEFYLKWGKL